MAHEEPVHEILAKVLAPLRSKVLGKLLPCYPALKRGVIFGSSPPGQEAPKISGCVV